MKKIQQIIITAVILISANAFSQVGINTGYPKQLFHTDGGKDNVENPTAAQAANDVVITNDGKVGVGLLNPSAKLEIKTVNPATDDGLNADGAIYFPTTATNPIVGPYSAVAINHSTGKLGIITPGAPPVFTFSNNATHTAAGNCRFIMATGQTVTYNTLGVSITADATNGDYFTLPEAGVYRIDVTGAMVIEILGGTAWAPGSSTYGANLSISKQPSTGGTITSQDIIRATLSLTNNSYPFNVTKIIQITESTRIRLTAITDSPTGVRPVVGGVGSTFAYQVIVTKL